MEKGNKTVYSCVPSLFGFVNFSIIETVIHELMHSIANPIAEVLYAENEEFRVIGISSSESSKHKPRYHASAYFFVKIQAH